MSVPQSRLSEFQSYSYYHILLMCDSTKTADDISVSSDDGIWDHATRSTAAAGDDADESLGIYSPKRIDSAGKYVVLINGSTDASYVIQHAQWTSTTAGDAAPGDRSSSIAVEGSLSISEPKGIAFLDQVVKCSVALGVDSSQVVYLLKTIFVGHKPTDAENASQLALTDIPPVMFLTYDVTGEFTEAGGSYEMAFVGVSHGAPRLPQYSKMVNSLTLKAGDDLESTITKLQDNVNESYDRYYECVRSQVGLIQNEHAQQLLKSMRKVKYVIEVDEAYTSAKGGSKYKVTDQAQQFKSGTSCDEKTQIVLPQHTSIETAISTIMSMCPEVRKDMVDGDANGIKYEYKIQTTYSSTPGTGDDSNAIDYEVYYRVDRFATPKTIAQHPVFETLAEDDPETLPEFAAIRNNVIEFDYLYTGKNTDILEFDMKLNTGLAYLQIATMVNAFRSQADKVGSVVTVPSNEDVTNYQMRQQSSRPLQVPILFGSQVRVPTTTYTNDTNSLVQSLYTMTKHASIEVQEASAKIMGNDLLLGSTNRTTSPTYVKTTSKTAVSDAGDQPKRADFQCWSKAPAYAKINIKMPRLNDDLAVYTGATAQGEEQGLNYAVDFWFDGYYYVHSVQHVFDGGEFTQQLMMLGIPKRSAFTSVASSGGSKDVTTIASSCFDSQVTCSGGKSAPSSPPKKTSPSPTIAEPPPSQPNTTQATPSNTRDADDLSSNAQGLDNVTGWANASPAVKTAIINASNSYNVDVVTMARMAQIESNFKPGIPAAQNRSKALGLYQFIPSTWTNMKNQGKIKGLSPKVGDAQSLPLRTDPQLSANAGASYMRDNISIVGSSDMFSVYAAHFMGPDTARKFIAIDKASGGRAKASSVGTAKWFRGVRSANPEIYFREDVTTGEVRAILSKRLAATLRNGNMQVARKPADLPKQDKPQPTTVPPATTVPTSPKAYEAVSASRDCDADTKTDGSNCNITTQQKQEPSS